MLDIASKHNRSILGINIRYYTGTDFVIRTIGMELLTNSHTAQEIHTLLTKTLNDFEIEPIQVIAYTTDNAGNVVNVVDWLNRDLDDFLMERDFDFDNEIFASLNNDFFGHLVEDFCGIMEQKRITYISCAAHSEQLSVKDALKIPEFAAEISFVKCIVKELRTPTFVNMLRERNLNQAIADHEIRWNYTYLMYNRLLELRSFVDEIGQYYEQLKVPPDKWAVIEVIAEILKEPYKVTVALQRPNYTLSDFFGDWLRMKHNLKKIPNQFAQHLLDCLENREQPLLNHSLMLSTVYLDPRYNFLLTSTQKRTAAAQLAVLWSKITISNSNPIPTTIDRNDADDDFASYLKDASNRTHPDPEVQSDIMLKIKSFLNRPPVNYKTNIFEYWTSIKSEEPELFKLITVLFSIPATQASVERCFSSLTYIFNNYRARLDPATLKEVLILRLNYDLIRSIAT